MFAVLTIASREYDAQYKVHSDSVSKYIYAAKQVRVIPELRNDLQVRYPIQDMGHFVCAIRPAVVLELFKQGFSEVLFCGADVVFYSTPYELLNCESKDVAITPHSSLPFPDDGLFPSNTSLSKSGHLNSDLVLWKNTPQVVQFLEWQAKIHESKCVIADGIFLDQTWLNFVPFVLDNVLILKHKSYNRAYFNEHETPLKVVDGRFYVDVAGSLHHLICYQFSGFCINKLSKHQNRFTPSPDLKLLIEDYNKRLEYAKSGN